LSAHNEFPGGDGRIDSGYAWARLLVAVLASTVGGVGMWSFMVALPGVQAEFGISRGEASIPYTAAMCGVAVGSIAIGRLSDRAGIIAPMLIGVGALFAGYLMAGYAPHIILLAAAYGIIGFGASATFAPMIADISHWFVRHRGIAIAICASGNYFAGAIWPPVVQHFVASSGWRVTHIGIALFCAAMLLPLTLLLRRPSPRHDTVASAQALTGGNRTLGFSPNTLQFLLCVAGVSCCIAMAMPQVHIVSYCGDLGYGVARGAEMLALMLGAGVISRIASGFIADRIGGIRTLLLGSVLQGATLALYLIYDGLVSLYVISILFGLVQGGIVPSYAVIVREYFPASEAATRVGLVITSTLIGMAVGGWMSGAIFDLTGSYAAAFINGLLWNVLNAALALWLFLRQRPGQGGSRPETGRAMAAYS
jgi:MFS family permease